MLVTSGWNKQRRRYEVNVINVQLNQDIAREVNFALDIELPGWELWSWNEKSITFLTDFHSGFFLGMYVSQLKKVLPETLGMFSYQFKGDRKTLYYL